MKVLKYLDDHLEELLIGVALSALTIIMFVQIVLRTVFSSALPWAEEVCRYLFVWCGCLGISFSTKEGSHLNLDILPSLMPFLKKPFEILSDVAMLVLCAVLVKPGVQVVGKLFSTGQLSAAMRIPMAYVYLALLVGVILTILRLVEKYIKKAVCAGKKTKKGDAK